ncbi:MAG: AAA family ATPase [Syntrophaceae bacterium]|nr:AAA family ATPase [Syntrophaceae bacterium]
MNLFPKKKKLINPFLGDSNLKFLFQQDTYESFYHFLKDPFAPHPDPNLFFLTDNFREVWNSVLQGIIEKKGFILLTGEKGIGKTTLMALVYLYLTTNGRKVKAIPLFDPPHTIEDLLRVVLRNLGFPAEEENKSAMLSRLDEDILRRSAEGETVALILDEAQNLRKEVLEDIRLLANPDPRRPKLLQEIFVGAPQFEKILKGRGLWILNQRFEVRCRLCPFSLEESLAYIEHRLNRVGSSTAKVFTPRAVYLIVRHARGIPGALNRLCQEALLVAYTQLKERSDSADVREAIAHLEKSWLGRWRLRGKIRFWLSENSAER